MRERLQHLIAERLTGYAEGLGIALPAEQLELSEPPDPAMGDFAMNLPMKLARVARRAPIAIAGEIADLLRDVDVFAKVEVAPPGYINLTLADYAVSGALQAIVADANLKLMKEGVPQTVVLDYSGVNIAKQMHVGHLRSTIIGDVIGRVLEARGERVIRQNHLGDWGLPIAMVLWKAGLVLRDIEARGDDPLQVLTVADLEQIYRDATAAVKVDPNASEEVHRILVELQSGDPRLLADWQTITRLSMQEVYRVYTDLGVQLTMEDERGESFYRDQLAGTVASLTACGALTESQGAMCVFLEQFKGKDGQPLPVIVQKSDGGYNYETFDLAAIRFRIEGLSADRVIYVTDARQALHFAQVFAVADLCGWTVRGSERVALEHVTFGSVLGEDGKPLKTRSGENVKLVDLLDEAVARAYAVVNEKNPDLPEDQKRAVARAVGIGAVKYSDLRQDRNNDYVFDWDRMLALVGNTAPYLQYAHARICSIFRKGGVEEDTITTAPEVSHPAERALALKLLAFAEVVEDVEAELRPHALCTYLYELATAFSSFYDQCPVLTAETEASKQARLALCRAAQRTLARGLDLLGIEAPREM
ncbi:MAG: Arginine--tRNA ligase [bacterium ADurb.Bin429]|nr:MAG: Arginine--tRNA ligase [bacterium ADurb.Bin429]